MSVPRITYAWAGHPELSLAFVLVTPPDEPAAYVSTTEVSIGFFKSVAKETGADAWQEVANNLAEVTSWGGPRGWEKKGQGIDLREEWLWISPQREGHKPFYAPSVGSPPPPNERSPMHWIKPEGAEAFAELVGCRLPTTAEWKAAREKERKDTIWNLRDSTWTAQYKFDNRQHFPLPDRNIFKPDGLVIIPDGSDERNDGTLWFDDVDISDKRGQTFIHIIGNVAEFVRDGNTFAVIGGSALSPPELNPDKKNVLNREAAFSDVGFRLAFDARKDSFVVYREEIQKGSEYLLGGHK